MDKNKVLRGVACLVELAAETEEYSDISISSNERYYLEMLRDELNKELQPKQEGDDEG